MRVALVLVLLTARALAQPADWSPHRDPFDPQVVARYKQILARDPHDVNALAKLQQLYRSFRTIDALESEYAAAPEDHGTLVVRARLRLARNDNPGALELFAKATAADPGDARAWLAVGSLQRHAGEHAKARAAFDQALAATPPKPLAEEALRALIEIAVVTKDVAEIDAGYTRLLALEPGDVELWIARGDALANAGRLEGALDAFAAAERMLDGNPQRKLDVIAHRGNVLEQLHDDRGALAEYKRAIALAPPGYYLVTELTERFIAIYRRQKALPTLIERLEKEWPERTRGHREWNTLGTLYGEVGDRPHAIVALQHAAKIAPGEIETQRRLIALLEQAGRHDAATAQYAAAIKAAPGDSTLALELAARTWQTDKVGASAILHRLATRDARDPEVLRAIADLYTKWGVHSVARGIYEDVAKLEPEDEDHWLSVARSYAATGDFDGALAAWDRVAHRQPGALLRLGELMLDEGAYDQAITALTESIELDEMNPAPYRARAWAYDGISNEQAAIEDAEHELRVAPPDGPGHRSARHHIVQLLVKSRGTDGNIGSDDWDIYTKRWHDEFMVQEPPNIDAGYLLVDAYETAECQTTMVCDSIAIVDKLAELEPDDLEVLHSQVRAYRAVNRVAEAIEKLDAFARRVPVHAKDIERQIASIKKETGPLEAIDDPFDGGPLDARYFADGDGAGSRLAIGAHLGVGADMHGDMGSSLTIGLAARYRLTHQFALDYRADWTERGGSQTAPNALGASVGVLTKIVEGKDSALAAGIGERAEVRFGDQMSSADRTWGRFGMAGEASLDLLLHDSPVGIGGRLEQWFLGGQHDTRAVLDFTVQWR
jgi:tetratricopeptide (TPR) repeat protein